MARRKLRTPDSRGNGSQTDRCGPTTCNAVQDSKQSAKADLRSGARCRSAAGRTCEIHAMHTQRATHVKRRNPQCRVAAGSERSARLVEESEEQTGETHQRMSFS